MSTEPRFRKLRRFYTLGLLFTFVCSLIAPYRPVMAQAFQPPAPLLPADYSTILPSAEFPLAVPDFSWTQVVDATEYKIQISTDVGFANIRVNTNTQNTYYTPNDDNSLLDGVLYWRVRVEKPEVSDFSPVAQFTKAWSDDSNAPLLVAPDDGVKLDFFENNSFSWQAVWGAARYRFQIATDANGFNTPVYTKDTFATAFQPNDFYKNYGNGTYYWRVLPLDPFDRAGASSAVRQFDLSYGVAADGFSAEIPTLLEPANNSTPTFTPTFIWTAVRGAEKYELEYTTDPTCSFQTKAIAQVTKKTTRSTSYTLYDDSQGFPNDVNYCWHVRAISGKLAGDWSPTWQFTKQWYIKPVALTPTQNYPYGLYPFFSWSPVPGAAWYQIEVDLNPDFLNLFDSQKVNVPYFTLSKYIGTTNTPYYWRVTPYDGYNKPGKSSIVASFTSYYTATAPLLYYPFYYYVPNYFPPPFNEAYMNPYSDNTAPLPIFMWHRVLRPFPYGGVYADAYRIQVSDDSNFPSSIWTVDTENLSATPLLGDAFRPSINQDYFWRVCPLDALGGNCLKNEYQVGNQDTWWSQTWKARFDPARAPTPTNGSTPQLLRPLQGDEFVEMTPLLEWFPLQNADYYEVQISSDPAFSAGNIVDTQSVPYPSYTPLVSLAQRSLGRTNTYGTYYWRVRAHTSGGMTGWSSAWRFQIASQTEWKFSRSMGDASNRLEVATDPVGDVSANFDLTDLNVAQSSDYWFFGFQATATSTDMNYGLYLDLDHVDGSGATQAPIQTYSITTIPAHQPEYAVIIKQVSNNFTASNVNVYKWNGTGWDSPIVLSNMAGGAITFISGYVEIRIPNTAIGMQDTTNSAAMSLFSVDTATNQVMDSVPSDPNVPGSAQLSRFTSASDRLNTHIPPSNSSGDPYIFNYTPPFFWDQPTGSDPTGTTTYPANPYAGHWIEVHLDPEYTSPDSGRSSTMTSSDPYFDQPSGTIYQFKGGDNTYYWRVRTRYFRYIYNIAGTWTNGGSYERRGFVPENLQTSTTFATPTFTWDMVENAQSYNIQVDTNPNFNTPVINKNTKENSFTPVDNLPNGLYYWRVRVIIDGNYTNDWSAPQSFTLSLPVPDGLTTNGADTPIVVPYAPTLCWQPVIASANGRPVLAAWKYRLQVSQVSNFAVIFDNIDTEQNCFTPAKAYDDGGYYWRVAMLDGNNNLGSYSAPAQFTKQYPAPQLLAPLSGSQTSVVPTFKWAPVDGAAKYLIEISLSSTFGTMIDSITTNNVHFSPWSLNKYPNNQVYYWRVSMIDKDNKRGPASDAVLILGSGRRVYLPFQTR